MSDVVNLGVLSEIFNAEPALSSAAAKKLENDFEEQDRMLILLYFRWLTRIGARDLGITHLERSSSMTDATREWLKTQGLENVDDWEFMGMIDHGSTASNITCSHGGHRLRYAYYANSPSTGKELVFGLGCGSEFFQVDLGLMKKLTKVIDTAKYELSCAFFYGRAHIQMAYSPAVTMAQVMRHDERITSLCYRYAGKTQIELWLNFINRGIMPPKTLLLRIEQAYKMAISDRLNDFHISSRLVNVYNSVITNELVYQGDDILLNKGIVTKGEFIYPLSGENLFNALRVCAIEELMQPSPISTYYNICELFTKIDNLERESSNALDEGIVLSRAKVLHTYLSGQQAPIKDALSCLTWACVTNDARYVTLFFGLSPSSNSVLTEDWYAKCWGQTKFDYRLFMAKLSKRKLFLLLFISFYDKLISEIQRFKSGELSESLGVAEENIFDLLLDIQPEDDEEDTDETVVEQEVMPSVTKSQISSEEDEQEESFDDDELAEMFGDDDEEFEEDYEDEDAEDNIAPSSLSDILMSGTIQDDED